MSLILDGTAGLFGNVTGGDISGNIIGLNGNSIPVTSTGSTTARSLENRFADVINVLDFGAHSITETGYETFDSTTAIQAAIDYARIRYLNRPNNDNNNFGVGGLVLVPSGIYGVSSDIDIPEFVRIEGESIRATVIRWTGSGNPTEAVITSNLDMRFNSAHGCGVKNMTIDANGKAVAIKVRGWNEGCELENAEFREFTDAVDGGVQILGDPDPTSAIGTSQNFIVRNIWIFGLTGARCLLLRGTNRITLENVSIAIGNYNAITNPGPLLSGIELRQVCRQNVFINPNVEDCSRPYDIGTVSNVSGNTFINVLSDAPFCSALLQPTTIGSVTEKMGFIVRAAASSEWGQIIGSNRSRYYDSVYFDEPLNIRAAGAGGTGYAILTGSFGPNPGLYTTPRVDRILISNTNNSTPDASLGNVISFSNSLATSVTSFINGVQGQTLICRFANSLTTVVNGANIKLATANNFTGTTNATLILTLVGSTWFETSRSYNASTGTYTISNVTTDRTYDANATTVDELADVLGTLIADLNTRGVI
jgi:hypothetical protein